MLEETRLKEQAERTLEEAKHENSQLEDTLKSYLDKMSNAHAELEDLRFAARIFWSMCTCFLFVNSL